MAIIYGFGLKHTPIDLFEQGSIFGFMYMHASFSLELWLHFLLYFFSSLSGLFEAFSLIFFFRNQRKERQFLEGCS